MIALSIAKTFMAWTFKKMNEKASYWGFDCNHFHNDAKTFQDICDEYYNGDVDECVDKFFRNIMNDKIGVQHGYMKWDLQWHLKILLMM